MSIWVGVLLGFVEVEILLVDLKGQLHSVFLQLPVHPFVRLVCFKGGEPFLLAQLH